VGEGLGILGNAECGAGSLSSASFEGLLVQYPLFYLKSLFGSKWLASFAQHADHGGLKKHR